MSPVDIILEPPDKLVIEVESSGGYYRHAWYKNDEEQFPNGDSQFREDNPERFSEFFQVFVQDPTTTSDHGIYRVDLIDDEDAVLETQEFIVTPPGEFNYIVPSLRIFSFSCSECGCSQLNKCHSCGGR